MDVEILTEERNKDVDEEIVIDCIPKLGFEFDSEKEAYDFYNKFGKNSGFSIRKEGFNKSKVDGVLSWRKFTCCKEGFRSSWEPVERKFDRAETRTGCHAHMTIKFDRKKKKYYVNSLDLQHNHPLHIAPCCHMLPSQRGILKAQALQIDVADASGIRLKDAYEFMSRQAGGRDNLGFTKQDLKNYLHSKRQCRLKYGEAGSLLRYFQQQRKANASFYYAVQLDAAEQITNIFWADAQMIINYKQFGDVVSFDTTYRTNKEYRPLAMFVGFNQYRESVMFGAALLYDETAESFQWLFETFFEAMSGKKPKTIFTDQDLAMAKAISLVMPETYHRLCKWHMMQNALKNINHLMRGDSRFKIDFEAFFKYWEEEEEFFNAWDVMLHKYNVQDNSWLQGIFELRKKWAKAYVKMTFSAGMTTTQLSESMNSELKKYVQSDYDIVKFFDHFERIASSKQYKELEAEYNSRQKLPKIKIKSPMLQQAAEVYTPSIFLKFQDEYEEFQGAFIKERNENPSIHKYVVSICGQKIDRRVTWYPLQKTIECSCAKFESFGILCSHALKILDIKDIKNIPEIYILKRWRKDVRDEIVQDFNGKDIQMDTNLEVTTRYQQLCSIYVKLAARAAECEESFMLAMQNSNELCGKIEDFFKRKDFSQTSIEEYNVNGSYSILKQGEEEDLLDTFTVSAKGLKKKEGCKGRRRLKSCIENIKRKRKSKVDHLKDVTRRSQSTQDQYTQSTQINGMYNSYPSSSYYLSQIPSHLPVSSLDSPFSSINHLTQDLNERSNALASNEYYPYLQTSNISSQDNHFCSSFQVYQLSNNIQCNQANNIQNDQQRPTGGNVSLNSFQSQQQQN